MASTRPRRDVCVSPPSQSDMEDMGSDSDYSPGSLIIDMGTDEVVQSSPAIIRPLSGSTTAITSINTNTSSSSSSSKGKKSVARRQYNTESNRMVFTGVSLRGQMNVIQSGHSQPTDRLDLYSFGWGDFHLDIITSSTHSFIPVKNIYEKVIPGLKRNVLSARISKLQVKSEALTEPYITSMKKLGLVVTGASHFVGITDFIKICRYFHVQPPTNLIKFCNITSELDPDGVVRSFSSELSDSQMYPPLTGDKVSHPAAGGGGGGKGLMSLLSGGSGSTSGGGAGAVMGGQGEGERPSSRGSAVGGDISASPHNASEEVDVRQLALPGGVSVSVVIRSGEPYLLKVELGSILPSHSRDVLETIRRTYGVTVTHASKAEVHFLKSKGVVGGKAGRCALFRASDVCQMFHHWKTAPPPALADLASGKLPSERMLDSVTEDSELPPSYSLPSYGFPLDDLPSFSDIPSSLSHSSLPHTSTTFTPSHSHVNVPPPFSSPQHASNTHHHQAHESHMAPRLSHPPTVTPSPFPPISSLSPDHFQQPIQLLTSIQSAPLPHQFSPSQPPFSTPPPYPMSTPSHPHFSTPSHPPYAHQSHIQQPTFTNSGMPQQITGNLSMGGHDVLAGGAMGKPPVISSSDYSRPGVKVEGSGGGRKRSVSTSGPPLDDEELDYVSMVWGERELTLVCPAGGAEPFIAIPELVDKIFHNRAHVSAQRRNELGITTLPATSLQMHILRAKGSLDAFTGNTKLVSLSGAVKLAAVSNIQIPGTVIQMIRKYCKEPLESIITPAGFAPATHPPSSLLHQTHHSPAALTSQLSYSHSSQSSHSDSLSQDTESYSVRANRQQDGQGKAKAIKSEFKGASPYKVVKSSNDESAASVSPQEGVPHHPDLIDPGPSYTNTGDGTYCLVKWGRHKLALLIGSQKVHYMGLYQVFQSLFKQYVTRMNFKMRMRKLEIKSIRAASSVRQALINLDALPQSSPVCGLIRVSEVERLARSYGVEPPQVLYDVFLLRHSDQKQLPNYSRSTPSSGPKPQEESVDKSLNSRGNLGQFVQGPQEMWGSAESLMREQAALMDSLPFGGVGSLRSNLSSSQTVSTTHSLVITTATSDENALMVSVPRQALTSQFRLVSRPVAPPGLMTGFHSSRTSYPPLTPRGSMLRSLARKISQKSRKLGKGKTSGVGAVRSCPKCQFVNPASKKRCSRCEEFMVGRHCPSCGTLNHNRTRECFKCNALIEDGGMEGEKFRAGNSEDSLSPESSLSPHFSPPPIRNAALKSMFPQDSGKTEDSGVVTKTMFSGNLASSRKCLECGQLNSKMAKKCLQCKSPLQGRPCPQCTRPNHSHSTECYKCGHSLPCNASKWVYVGSGSSSNKIYRSQESNSSSRLAAGLRNRAATVCLRCDRLRNSGRFTCGRCGDMYWTKPVVGGASETTDTPTSISKKKKAGLEPNWSNVPSEPDPEEMMSFASNLLCLGIGEGLLSLVAEAETRARETVHQAEEELEGIEEEYQSCARQREEKEGILNDARAELDMLIADLKHSTNKLSELEQEKENAEAIVSSHPDTISQLEGKIDCALKILISPPPPHDTVTDGNISSDIGLAMSAVPDLPDTLGESMDTTQ